MQPSLSDKDIKLQIEPVKSSEVDALAGISRKSFYDTFHLQNSEENMKFFLNESFDTETLTQEMLQKENYFFFARMGDDIAGYLKLSIAPPPGEIEEAKAVEIARIYVSRDKIGSGVGKKLMEFVFSFARELNRTIIWLGVWEHNHRAINFYRKYGFVKFDEHIFMVGNDPQSDWLMKKELQPQ